MKKNFEEYESEVTSFSRVSTDVWETIDIGTSTAEVVSYDKEVQSVTTRDIEIQTSFNAATSTPPVDENALSNFLRKAAPILEEQLKKRSKHFGLEYQLGSSGNENEIYTKKIIELNKHNIENGEINHISWSCYGHKLALSISHFKHEDWCKHISHILVYECDNKNEEFCKEAKECVEVNTCVTDLKFHPFLETLFIFATEEGKIYRHNLLGKQENNSTSVVCVNDSKFTQISWITLNSQLYLTGSSVDGLLGLWMPSSFTENWKLIKKFTFKTMDDLQDRSISCYEFSKLNSQHFVVALEGGLLYRCSAATAFKSIDNDFPNPVVNDFECSSCLINYLSFSSFDENIFLTIAIDQNIRIYHLNEKSPINVIFMEYLPIYLRWNRVNEDIFETCTINGEILSYNYRKASLIKTWKACNEIISVDSKVKGTKKLFAVADSKNNVSIWETSLSI